MAILVKDVMKCFPYESGELLRVVEDLGLEAHVAAIKEMVLLPLTYPSLFSDMGLTPPRGVLFHGPPGTGKTMVARRVAYHSGLEFAIMSGGDVAPLKARAVTEIHKLVNITSQILLQDTMMTLKQQQFLLIGH